MNNSLWAVSGGKGRDVILLHGLFGRGSNLRGIARALEPHFRVHCLDLPDHGRSPWLTSASLDAYAEEVAAWMISNRIDEGDVIGHSLGGKVAMQLALNHAARVRRLVVVDIAPVRYPAEHMRILAVLARVRACGCKSRAAAEALMVDVIPEPEVRAYLLMSLTGGAEGYQWRFNLTGLTAGYEQLRAAPGGQQQCQRPALFLRGGDSGYITANHLNAISRRFPHSSISTVPDAGHWVHIDQPRLVHDAIRAHLLGDAASNGG
jgi:esterase